MSAQILDLVEHLQTTPNTFPLLAINPFYDANSATVIKFFVALLVLVFHKGIQTFPINK
jgi:hypothetical protein